MSEAATKVVRESLPRPAEEWKPFGWWLFCRSVHMPLSSRENLLRIRNSSLAEDVAVEFTDLVKGTCKAVEAANLQIVRENL
jgi:hypothetical protein